MEQPAQDNIVMIVAFAVSLAIVSLMRPVLRLMITLLRWMRLLPASTDVAYVPNPTQYLKEI